MITSLKRVLAPLIVIIGVLCLWELGVKVFHIKEYLLPAPSRIATETFNNLTLLLYDLGYTTLESIAGFLLGAAFAIFFASIFAHSSILRNSIFPCLISLKAIPIVAIAPLLIVWLGNGFVSKSIMAALICFFPIVVNTTKGLMAIEQEHLDLFKSLSASRWQLYVKVRFPSAIPYIFAALKISSTLSVVGAIVAEFSGANHGIGYVILLSALRIETAMLFAAIVLASLLGIVFFYLIQLCETLLVRWQNLEAQEA